MMFMLSIQVYSKKIEEFHDHQENLDISRKKLDEILENGIKEKEFEKLFKFPAIYKLHDIEKFFFH